MKDINNDFLIIIGFILVILFLLMISKEPFYQYSLWCSNSNKQTGCSCRRSNECFKKRCFKGRCI